jgi:hypothetical protein
MKLCGTADIWIAPDRCLAAGGTLKPVQKYPLSRLVVLRVEKRSNLCNGGQDHYRGPSFLVGEDGVRARYCVCTPVEAFVA